MRRDVGAEKQRQRMMHQINEQRRINEIGDARGFKVQQPMPQRKDHIHHPQSQHHSNHAFGFIHPCIAAAITLIQQIGDKRQCRAKGAAARWRGEQGFQFGMDKRQGANNKERQIEEGLHDHKIEQAIAEDRRIND